MNTKTIILGIGLIGILAVTTTVVARNFLYNRTVTTDNKPVKNIEQVKTDSGNGQTSSSDNKLVKNTEQVKTDSGNGQKSSNNNEDICVVSAKPNSGSDYIITDPNDIPEGSTTTVTDKAGTTKVTVNCSSENFKRYGSFKHSTISYDINSKDLNLPYILTINSDTKSFRLNIAHIKVNGQLLKTPTNSTKINLSSMLKKGTNIISILCEYSPSNAEISFELYDGTTRIRGDGSAKSNITLPGVDSKSMFLGQTVIIFAE